MGSGTNIGRVRGLGSAQEGAHHWIVQRVTAVSNLLLVLWLVFSLIRLPQFGHEVMVEWLASPLVAVPMMLMLVSVFWHLRIGLQVLIEDYVPDHGMKFGLMILLNFFAIGGAALGIFSVAKIAFTGVVA
ncbi:MAG: succinate dehydrogenase / fumarate reductase membrane anchor subunit [Parasphingorhabdus sp.]|jgi:succinate dehydrogenase / fumarate reductase membrane anchor subunit|uniref:succinate dehydrogenase, hydrophobic membrane anchor protein n=1 Tax=Parasphingorhabdus sp. TaxID=2709688 RepID=UPI001B7C9527|nr:succinate dehydrogenase, hydrophobic membrane anchor protein [Parasphingorhabdus sp.]MBQ0771376.1 succinate dehydrogenase, hydrophobic membrane anchor protein [Sphingomonadales bacterium]|tara:strand:+ start:2523 stop:2912 length:390 start_codon:yes stop_codon:yes gene_type:complete